MGDNSYYDLNITTRIMSDSWLNRRRFVAGLSSAGLGGIAGCTTSSGGDDDSTPTTTPTLSFSQSDDSDFPRYSGTVAISGDDDYWSFKIQMESSFGLRYTVTNGKSDDDDFDVFVHSQEQYGNYLQEIRDTGPAIEEIEKLSSQGVRSEAQKSGELDAGTYFFVVDNTDIGDAGDFGGESPREVTIELETDDPANITGTPTPEEADTTERESNDEDEKSNVELLEEKYPNYAFIDGQTYLVILKPIDATADSYSLTISGTAVNGSESNYEYVQITFGLYAGPNGTGAKVGTAVANISGLESGQKWRFEAIGSAEDASSFDIQDTTAY